MRLALLASLTAAFVAADAMAGSTRDAAAPPASSPAPSVSPTCDAALGAAGAALDGAERIEPHEANALHAQLAAAAGEPACASALAAVIERTPVRSGCRTNAYGIVVSAAFSSPAFEPRRMAAIVSRTVDAARSGDDACARAAVPAVQQAGRVTEDVRAVLSGLARSPDAPLAEAGWLVLGTTASIARAGGDDALAGSIDQEIGTALARASADERSVLLEAAGNAGCQSCGDAMALAGTDVDAWTRRAAAGAWRFVPDGASPMCSALSDPSPVVREHAAWALGLAVTEPHARGACLSRALATDENADVRAAAKRSLELLEGGN